MRRHVIISVLVTVSPLASAAPAFAQTAPTPATQPAPAPAAKFTTAETSIGDLIDNPATKTILDKHLREFASNPQLEMARGMTLKRIQSFVPDQIKEETLAKIDEDLAKL